MVSFKILSVNPVDRVVSVIFKTGEGEIVGLGELQINGSRSPMPPDEHLNNIFLVGPVANQIDMDDQDAMVSYLKAFGEDHYGQEQEPHPLAGRAF